MIVMMPNENLKKLSPAWTTLSMWQDMPHVLMRWEMIETGKEKAMEATDRTLGGMIKTMRTSCGLTQSEIAEAVYSDVSSICRWEHGENITGRFHAVLRGCGQEKHSESKNGRG